MTRRGLLPAVAAAMMTAMPALAEVAPTEVAFADGAVETSLTGTPGDPKAGAVVMTTSALGNCVACHEIGAMPDVEFPGNIGPALDGAADRWTEAQLRGIVIDAKHTFPDSFMPGMYKTAGFIRPGNGYTGQASDGDPAPILSAQQVEDVVAYLMTLTE